MGESGDSPQVHSNWSGINGSNWNYEAQAAKQLDILQTLDIQNIGREISCRGRKKEERVIRDRIKD